MKINKSLHLGWGDEHNKEIKSKQNIKYNCVSKTRQRHKMVTAVFFR